MKSSETIFAPASGAGRAAICVIRISGPQTSAILSDLTGSLPPYKGRIVVLLERAQDEWLARWSGADAWFTKPVNPFELADRVGGFLTDDSQRREAG